MRTNHTDLAFKETSHGRSDCILGTAQHVRCSQNHISTRCLEGQTEGILYFYTSTKNQSKGFSFFHCTTIFLTSTQNEARASHVFVDQVVLPWACQSPEDVPPPADGDVASDLLQLLQDPLAHGLPAAVRGMTRSKRGNPKRPTSGLAQRLDSEFKGGLEGRPKETRHRHGVQN